MMCCVFNFLKNHPVKSVYGFIHIYLFFLKRASTVSMLKCNYVKLGWGSIFLNNPKSFNA